MWYRGPKAITDAIDHAKFFSRSHDAVVRIYDQAGNVIKTHEQAGDFKEWWNFFFILSGVCSLVTFRRGWKGMETIRDNGHSDRVGKKCQRIAGLKALLKEWELSGDLDLDYISTEEHVRSWRIRGNGRFVVSEQSRKRHAAKQTLLLVLPIWRLRTQRQTRIKQTVRVSQRHVFNSLLASEKDFFDWRLSFCVIFFSWVSWNWKALGLWNSVQKTDQRIFNGKRGFDES
jgi:hypothetical protein